MKFPPVFLAGCSSLFTKCQKQNSILLSFFHFFKLVHEERDLFKIEVFEALAFAALAASFQQLRQPFLR